MTTVALEHIGQNLLRDDHRRNSIHLKGETDILQSLLIKSLVATDNARTIDENIHRTTLLFDLFVGGGNKVAIGDVHLMNIHAPARASVFTNLV